MKKYRLFIGLIIFLLLSGCNFIYDFLKPDVQEPTPLPTNTPIIIIPLDTPTPVPTPTNDMWGYVNGCAKVLVEGLNTDPENDKESIFHLYHPTTKAWMNIRHRIGGKYQPKGALNSEYGCCDEINYFDMKNALNGEWILEWGDYESADTWTVITAPDGESVKLWFEGGVAAWREVRAGSGDSRLPNKSSATIRLLDINGDIGLATICSQ